MKRGMSARPKRQRRVVLNDRWYVCLRQVVIGTNNRRLPCVIGMGDGVCEHRTLDRIAAAFQIKQINTSNW